MRKAFTLIELMVILVVVAVLACLLTACKLAFGEKARAISCINNLKQIDLGDIMYSNDFDDFFLPSKWGRNIFIDSTGKPFASDDMYWYCFNYATMDFRIETPAEWAAKGEAPHNLFLCPSLDKAFAKDGDPTKRPGIGYAANASIHFTNQYCSDTNDGGDGTGTEANGGMWNNWRRTIQSKSPDMLMLYWDRNCQAGIDASWQLYHFWKTKSGSVTIIEATSARHSKFGNVAFADGHAAATMTLTDWDDLEKTRTNSNAKKKGIIDKVHATIPLF